MSTAALNHEPAEQPPSPAQGPGDGKDQPGPTGETAPSESVAGGGLAAQSAERRAKRDALEDRGINPYPTRFDRTSTLAELRAAYGGAGAATPGRVSRRGSPGGW